MATKDMTFGVFGAVWISKKLCGIAISGEPVDPNGIVVEELFLVCLSRAASERQENVDPLAITGGKRANRPVTTEHHAIPAKAFDGVIDVGTQIFRGPVVRIGIGYQAGNLAEDIREFCDFAEVRAPGVEDLLLHLRYAAMVEDKGHIRATRNETNGKGQLACEDANIERKIVASQAMDILHECFALAQIIGLRVQNSANPFQFRMTQYLFQVGPELIALRASACHDPFQGIVCPIREPKKAHCLFKHKRLVH